MDSKKRQRENAEVFTPPKTVQAMLDMLPREAYLTSPSITVLDPACGDGNFLEAVLERKMKKVANDFADATSFKFLHCLTSIYGIDIAADNIEAAIERQIAAFFRLLGEYAPTLPQKDLRAPVEAISRKNIIQGDTLNPEFIITEWIAYGGNAFVIKEYDGRHLFAEKTDLFTANPQPIRKSEPFAWSALKSPPRFPYLMRP